MSEEARQGLLSSILMGSPLAGLGITPKMVQRDIVIELTESQFKELILKNADARARSAVDVKFKEGRMILSIRLW